MVKVKIYYHEGDPIFVKCENIEIQPLLIIMYIWSNIRVKIVPVEVPMEIIKKIEVYN